MTINIRFLKTSVSLFCILIIGQTSKFRLLSLYSDLQMIRHNFTEFYINGLRYPYFLLLIRHGTFFFNSFKQVSLFKENLKSPTYTRSLKSHFSCYIVLLYKFSCTVLTHYYSDLTLYSFHARLRP